MVSRFGVESSRYIRARTFSAKAMVSRFGVESSRYIRARTF